jgi:hypothetical protein
MALPSFEGYRQIAVNGLGGSGGRKHTRRGRTKMARFVKGAERPMNAGRKRGVANKMTPPP